MPFHKRSYEFGNLFVIFDVTFPKSMPANKFAELDKALSEQAGNNKKANKDKKNNEEDEKDVVTCRLMKYDADAANTHASGGTHGDSEEEEESDGGEEG